MLRRHIPVVCMQPRARNISPEYISFKETLLETYSAALDDLDALDSEMDLYTAIHISDSLYATVFTKNNPKVGLIILLSMYLSGGGLNRMSLTKAKLLCSKLLDTGILEDVPEEESIHILPVLENMVPYLHAPYDGKSYSETMGIIVSSLLGYDRLGKVSLQREIANISDMARFEQLVYHKFSECCFDIRDQYILDKNEKNLNPTFVLSVPRIPSIHTLSESRFYEHSSI